MTGTEYNQVLGLHIAAPNAGKIGVYGVNGVIGVIGVYCVVINID